MRPDTAPVTVRRVVVASAVVLLVAGALGPVAGGMFTPDEEEPNDSPEEAQVIDTGEQITAELPEGDDDWFEFTAERGETINLTGSAGPDGTVSLQLRDENGEHIKSNRVSGGSTTIGLTATRSGTYYVRANLVNPGAEYSFTVETYRTDPWEPNEGHGNATRISPGERVTGNASIGDEDWFEFTAERGETINLTGSAGPDGTVSLQLRDENGEHIKSNRVSGGSTTIGLTATRSGTYYVRTNTVDPDTEYSFTLETYRTDYFEPNEDRGNATGLYVNPSRSGTATMSVGDDEWFAFHADAEETVTLSGYSGHGGTVSLQLRSPSGDLINGERVSGGSVSFNRTVSASGTYYVRVNRVERGAEYNFTVVRDGERLGLANDRFERGNPPVGNNDLTNASDVEPGTYGGLAIVDDDRDVFAVDLLEGERVRASIDFAHAENDLALELVDASGSAVASADSDSDGESLAYTAEDAGTYYLRVTGEDGAATKYDLNLTVVHPVTVTVGPGEGAIAPNETATLDVVVSNVNGGLTGGTFAFQSTDGSVLTVESVAAPTGSTSVDVSEDGTSATATITDLDPEVCGNVRVAQVTVESVESGDATLGAGVTLSGNEGHVYRVESVRNTTLSVDSSGGTSVDGTVSSETQSCPLDRAASTPAVSGSGGSDSESGSGGTDQSEGTSNGLGPGFGPLAALLALAVAALLARRRR